MNRWWKTRLQSPRSEDGAVAIIVALLLTSLIVTSALVLDFGLARLDRQSNKLASDSAVTAGLQALDGDDGTKYSFQAVCEAIEYLKASRPDLASLAWDQCGGANDSVVCNVDDASTHARFEQTVTMADGTEYLVEIRAPYFLDDDLIADASYFPEEAKSTLASDRGDDPCSQIGVNITQSREPGLGSLATDEDITSSIRSVGRVKRDDPGFPIALLLLETEDCGVLEISGAGAKIRVLGTPASGSKPSTPGLIHADSLGNGSKCSSVDKVYNGNKSFGIVAEESLDGLLSGVMTSTAMSSTPGAVREQATDPYDNVVAVGVPPAEDQVTGRSAITREPVDEVYLEPVRDAVSAAQGYVFGAVDAGNAGGLGWKVIDQCKPTQADVDDLNITSADNVFVDCTKPTGFTPSDVTIEGKAVYFNGAVSATNLSLPNATRVYIYGRTGPNAVGLDASGGFSMHDYGAGTCGISPGYTPTSGSKAQLFVKHGQVKQTGSTLRLCFTTLILMGGEDDACLPSVNGTEPTETPCAGVAGSGNLSISGGDQDWNAPNASSGEVADKSDLEDLALWGETYGGGPSYQMVGTGQMTLRGVFMVPNAEPFNIKGGGGQDVVDSQYIVTKLNVTGGGELLMQPTANMITVPPPPEMMLVR